MKRIIDSTLVILSLMLIFGCKESKVGQGNPNKDSMFIDTDSVISGKDLTKQDIASEDTLNAVIRTQSPKSKDFDFEVFIMRGEIYLSRIQRTILLTQMVAVRIAV